MVEDIAADEADALQCGAIGHEGIGAGRGTIDLKDTTIDVGITRVGVRPGQDQAACAVLDQLTIGASDIAAKVATERRQGAALNDRATDDEVVSGRVEANNAVARKLADGL